ncbi:hypothetical protein ES703_54270 [subsurface metagenome]
MPGHVSGRVPEQVLNPLGVPSLEPAFEDSRGVPEELRIHMDAGSPAPLIENFSQAVRGQTSPVQGEEEITMVGLGTPTQDIGSQCCSGGLVKAQELLPSHFPACDHQVAVFDIHLVELEAGELAGTKRGIEDHENDGFVPGAGRRADIDGPYQFSGLVEGKVRWQLVLDAWRRQSIHGAGRDDLFPDEPVEKGSECSEVRIHRDIRQFSCGMVTRVSFPFWLLPEPTQKIDDVFPLNFCWVRVDTQEAQKLFNCHFRISNGGRAAVQYCNRELAVVFEGLTESGNGHAETPSVPVSLLSPLSRGTRAYFIFRAVSIRPSYACGVPGGIRTHDPLLRRHSLCFPCPRTHDLFLLKLHSPRLEPTSIRPSIVANSTQTRKWFPYSGGHFGHICLC